MPGEGWYEEGKGRSGEKCLSLTSKKAENNIGVIERKLDVLLAFFFFFFFFPTFLLFFKSRLVFWEEEGHQERLAKMIATKTANKAIQVECAIIISLVL